MAPPSRRRRPRPRPIASFQEAYSVLPGVLGRGAGGRVLPCRGPGGESRAVKVMPGGPEARGAALREVGLAARCGAGGAGGVVSIAEYFEEGDTFYLVFERMDGSLADRLKRSGGRLPEREVAMVARQVTAALAHIHRLGVVHRDIKPGNVLYSGDTFKLCDFGLSSEARGGKCEGAPAGTADYLAPEVVRAFLGCGAAGGHGPPSDLWGLGATLHTLLTGRPPFQGRCGGAACGWDAGAACASCLALSLAATLRGGPALAGPSWAAVSPECLAFLRCLLRAAPGDRPTALEALAHPWLAGPACPDLHPQAAGTVLPAQASTGDRRGRGQRLRRTYRNI